VRPATSSGFDFSAAPGLQQSPECASTVCFGNTIRETFRGFHIDDDLYNFASSYHLRLPLNRYAVYGFGSYEIGGGVELYARGLYSHNETAQQVAPTGVTATFSVQDNNPFLYGPSASPAAAQFGALLALCGTPGYVGGCQQGDTNGDGRNEYQFLVARRLTEVGERQSARDSEFYQFGGGLRGAFGESDQWRWDVGANYGRSQADRLAVGDVSISALQSAVFAGTANIFVENAISDEAADAISRQTREALAPATILQVVASVNGEAGDKLPWTDDFVGITLGAEYRKTRASTFFPGLVIPPAPPTEITIRNEAIDAFTEVHVPVISDRRAVESFVLAGGYRYSHIASLEDADAYFVEGVWKVDSRLKLTGRREKSLLQISPLEALTPIATLPVRSGHETSTVSKVGAAWRVPFAEGLRVEANYLDVDVNYRLRPTMQQVLVDCSLRNIGCDLIVADPVTGLTPYERLSGEKTAVRNFKGLEFGAQYSLDSLPYNLGSLSLRADGMRVFSAAFRTNPFDRTSEVFDCNGLYRTFVCAEPRSQWKVAATGIWSTGDLSSSLRLRWISHVEKLAPSFQTISNIDSYATLDVNFAYDLWNRAVVRFGVNNVLNADVPILGDTDSEEANTWPGTYEVLGRQIFVGVAARF
jgi:hypothetical protein